MSRILLQENLPFGPRRILPGHEVAAAWVAGFEGMISADQSLRLQLDLRSVELAFAILSTNRWRLIEDSATMIAEAVANARPGDVAQVRLS